jgi:hypothetical protein
VAKIDVSALAANANGATCTGIRIVECHWILLPNSAEYGANGTGDIKFTTTGAGAAGDAYQVIIRAVKKY